MRRSDVPAPLVSRTSAVRASYAALGPRWPLLALPRRLSPGTRFPLRPIVLYAAVALAVLAVDVVTKRWSLALATQHVAWSDLARLTVVHNARVLGALSLGGYAPVAHSAVFLALIVLSAAICQRLASVDRAAPLAFGLLIGGALGNGIELLTTRAAATDFLAVATGHGGEIVFNFADMAAVAGLALLVGTAYKLVIALRAPRRPAPAMIRSAPLRAPSRVEIEVPRLVFGDRIEPVTTRAPASDGGARRDRGRDAAADRPEAPPR